MQKCTLIALIFIFSFNFTSCQEPVYTPFKSVLSYSFDNIHFLPTTFTRTPKGLLSQYQSTTYFIDLNQTNISIVLTSIQETCQTPTSSYPSLSFFAQAQFFLYYCKTNDSILYLDYDDYSIQASYDLGSDLGQYDNFRLLQDGDDALVLLAMSYTMATYFIKFNIYSKEVMVSWDTSLAFSSGTQVVAWGKNSQNEFVSTLSGDGSYQQELYKVTFTSSEDANILKIKEWSFSTNSQVPQIDIYGTGLVLILNVNKEIVGLSGETQLFNYSNVGVHSDFTNQVTLEFYYGPQSQSFYILFANSTAIQLNVQNLIPQITYLFQADQLFFAPSPYEGKDQRDILFYSKDDQSHFYEVDTNSVFLNISSQIPSKLIAGKSQFIKLFSSYFVVQELSTDSIIKNISFAGTPYIDPESNAIYYLKDNDETPCYLNSYNLNSEKNYEIKASPIEDSILCQGVEVFDVASISKSSAAFTLVSNSIYYIYTPMHKNVSFQGQQDNNGDSGGTVILDYTTLKVLQLIPSFTDPYQLGFYQYDAETGGLSQIGKKTSVSLQGQPFKISNSEILVLYDEVYYIIDLTVGTFTTSYMSVQWGDFSWTVDEYSRKYLFLSENNELSANDMPIIIDYYSVRDIPYSVRGETLDGGAAGYCAYYLKSQVGPMTVSTLYDICGIYSEKMKNVDI